MVPRSLPSFSSPSLPPTWSRPRRCRPHGGYGDDDDDDDSARHAIRRRRRTRRRTDAHCRAAGAVRVVVTASRSDAGRYIYTTRHREAAPPRRSASRRDAVGPERADQGGGPSGPEGGGGRAVSAAGMRPSPFARSDPRARAQSTPPLRSPLRVGPAPASVSRTNQVGPPPGLEAFGK